MSAEDGTGTNPTSTNTGQRFGEDWRVHPFQRQDQQGNSTDEIGDFKAGVKDMVTDVQAWVNDEYYSLMDWQHRFFGTGKDPENP